MRRLAFAAALVLSACATQRAVVFPTDPRCLAPAGQPSQMTTHAGPLDVFGFRVEVSAPTKCLDGVSIDLVASGDRPLEQRTYDVTQKCGGGEAPPADCATFCQERPAPDERCTAISALDLAGEAREQLVAGYLASAGYSACGEAANQVTLIVHDWAAADIAIGAAAGRLHAWRAGGRLRIAVVPNICVEIG